MIDFWHRSPFDPTKDLAGDFRVIAMDQRNRRGVAGAGQRVGRLGNLRRGSTGAARPPGNPAMSHHGRMHRLILLSGADQGSARRVSAAVLQNPIGLGPDGIARFHNMFDDWAGSSASGTPR